jgi:probable rRNA maturation factor
LSFALADRSDPVDDGELGEIFIAFPTASRQARAAGLSVHEELSHLLLHGVLHILGYDHESERDARRMRRREEAALGRPVH